MKINILNIKFLKKAATNFTFAKFLGAVSTIIIVTSIKYYISGNLSLEYSDFFGNASVGLLG